MLNKFAVILLFFALLSGTALAGEREETDSKQFKALKQQSIDPKTGLPKTLDPGLFRGKAKQAYQIAREIPEVLAQIPCFCECEAYGHENLLDCFIDRHGAG